MRIVEGSEKVLFVGKRYDYGCAVLGSIMASGALPATITIIERGEMWQGMSCLLDGIGRFGTEVRRIYYRRGNEGYGSMRASIIKKTKEEIVTLLDDDCVIVGDWSRLVEYIRNGEYAVVPRRIFDREQQQYLEQVGRLTIYGLTAKREVLLEVCDELKRWEYAEDVYLRKRLRPKVVDEVKVFEFDVFGVDKLIAGGAMQDKIIELLVERFVEGR